MIECDIDNLEKYNRIHLIGIGGISMSAIAERLKAWGYIVTGSDLYESEITKKLKKDGIDVVIGHDVNIAKSADLIIYNAAIPDTDPELLVAKENNIDVIGRGKFVGFLTKKYKEAICVSGTHGKTTTTSMLSICFLNANMDPSIEVGAILDKIDGNYRVGKSEYFILESCEYKANFLNFFPNSAIILNIDNDHLDYYKTFDNIIKTFNEFVQKVDSKGVVVVNGDDSNCLKLKENVVSKFITYGIENTDANFVAKNIEFNEEGFAKFDVYKDREFLLDVQLSVPGKHNILNSLAVIAISNYYGIDNETIKLSMLEFKGASRRMEYKGTVNNAKIFDDYGHHPTEVIATVKGIKNKKFNRSWVVFQPHTYSRTKAHLKEFAEALLEFDNIIITDIYAAREKNTFDISSKDLVEEIIKLGKDAKYISDFSEIVEILKKNVKENDLVLTLGAGTVTEIGPMLVNK